MDKIEELQDKIDELEDTIADRDCTIADLEYDLNEAEQEISVLKGQLLERPDLIDLLKLDPDPYGYHNLSLQARMEAMNLCSPRQGLRLS